MKAEPALSVVPFARPLTPKQLMFVAEYMIDLNATQAAIRAGYSKRTASEQASQLMRHPGVSLAIEAAKAQRVAATQVTAEFVLAGLKENLDRAMQAKPVLDREGRPTGEYVYDGSVANRALELMGKHIGMFTDRLDVRAAGVVTNAIDVTFSDDAEAFG